MADEGDASHSKSIPPKQAHDIGRALAELQEQLRKLTKEAEQVNGSAQRNSYQRGYDVSPIDLIYSSTHQDFDDEEGEPTRRRHPRNDLGDLKVEVLKFNSNLNPKNYLDWVQAHERIFELKDYNDEKYFKLVILKWKGYASLLYEHMNKSRVREAKSKIRTWSKLKKYMGKRFLPPFLQIRAQPQDHLSTKKI